MSERPPQVEAEREGESTGLSREEAARAYLAYPVLGPRECVAAVRAWVEKGRSLEAIFGELNAMKFRSSVEIFRS